MARVRNGDAPESRVGQSNGTDARQRVLYPVFGSRDDRTFQRALDLASGIDGELVVVDLTGGSEDGDGSGESGRTGPGVRDARGGANVRRIVEGIADPVDTVVDVARRHDARLAVFDEHTGSPLMALIRGDVSDRIGSRSPCDTVSMTHSATVERIASILVPVAGGAHSQLAVATAGALAMGTDAVVELFHVSDPGTDRDGPVRDDRPVDDLFATATARLPDVVDVDTWNVERPDVATAIVEQSRRYDVTVVGEPRRGRLRRFVAGSVATDVREDADNTVLTVRRSEGPGFGFPES